MIVHWVLLGNNDIQQVSIVENATDLLLALQNVDSVNLKGKYFSAVDTEIVVSDEPYIVITLD